MTTDVMENGTTSKTTVDDEAYTPTYAEAFPPLPPPEEGEAVPEEEIAKSAWGANRKLAAIRSRIVTQVFTVPLEERKFKELTSDFGEKPGRNQAKICVDIMGKTGVAIEMSLSKDQSLAFVITGKPDAVLQARKLVVQQLQTQASIQLKIPKEHHRFILGPKAKKLADLELQTATKISVPRPDNPSDEITITGTKEGIDKARHEILVISDEQSKLAFIRMPIPKIYHPFILGPNGQTLKDIVESTGARINMPPPSVMKDEIVVAGEKEGALRAEQAINAIYKAKKNVKAVAVEVKKSQHKYIIGPKGVNLGEILAETGVAVEVPALDSPSETITLRGDADKLGIALTAVYAKANSVVIQDVPVPGWLHRFIIGPKGANVREINQQFPKIHIEFSDEQDKVTIEGPPEEVESATKSIVTKRDDLLSRMAFVDLKIDPKYHRHIIGKSGANVMRIKQETGVSIRIPPDESHSNIVRIEGSPEGVAKAKFDLIDMIEKFDNEKTRDILIDHRFHKAIIGPQGSNIREIRDKFSQVVISFPDPSKQSDVVALRGPKQDVDECYKHLHSIAQDMAASSFKAEVHIFKEVHRNIIGKGGAKIRQIREETDTKIDLPKENSDSDVITITGKKENVEKAKNLIETIQKELANIKEITIDIPHDYHTSLIGAKGRLIRAVMEECGGVIIRFPGENTKSDKVMIRGPKDDVEKAKKQLLEMADQKKESSYTEEVRSKPELHGFLIGKKGSSIREIREQTGARIIFPSSKDPDQELITIVGSKEAVQKAKKDLEAKIVELEKIVEDEMEVDPKHHKHFTARRGETLQQIAKDCGGVVISFPRAAAASSRVALKGPKECIDAAKKRIKEVITDIENQVTIEFEVPSKLHGSIMGPKGSRIQEITKDHNVNVKFPDRKAVDAGTENGDGEGVVNGGEEGSPTHTPHRPDVILITGLKENCEAAKQAMQELLPISEEVEAAFEFHGQIIGQKGKDVRQLMDQYDVNISIPPPDQQKNSIKVTGIPVKVEAAKKALRERVAALEEEKKQRELKSFKLEVQVAAKHHTRIIGRKGVEVTKLRTKHDVQISFPGRDSEDTDTIIITGLKANAEACRDELLEKVKEMKTTSASSGKFYKHASPGIMQKHYEEVTLMQRQELQITKIQMEDEIVEEVSIDPRIHSRIIGAKGRSVARLMTEYKVDIRFPARDAEDDSIITITGPEENVLDCKDHLLNLEEEYIQDVADSEDSYRPSARPTANDFFANLPTPQQGGGQQPGPGAPAGRGMGRGFIVRDAPWSLSSTEEFPDLGSAAAAPSAASWPIRR